MKELSVEEKAKRYESSLERCRKLYNEAKANEYTSDIEDYETIFPELKESENERIRKHLISLVKNWDKGRIASKYTSDPNVIKQILAWLEKQGEHTDKVESKFHEGDWITNGDYTWKIVEVKPLDYILQSQDGNIVDDTISHVDEQFHSFTIEDAKDGDLLAGKIDGDNYILIFKQIKDGWIETHGHYYNTVDRFCAPSQLFCKDYKGVFHPATKEQRDTLMKAMADAGYTFDFEKKELKKIEQKPQRMISAEAKEAMYDKPAWCEKDEENLRDIIGAIHAVAYQTTEDEEARIEWLKSLKSRVQHKPELGKEDKEHIESILKRLDGMCKKGATFTETRFAVNQDMDWLKSLRDRVQPKQEWSKEDNKWIESLIQTFEDGYFEGFNQLKSYGVISWLKSLKQRIGWKPSDAQIQCLYDAIEHYQTNGYPASKLNELYEQMSKIYKL